MSSDKKEHSVLFVAREPEEKHALRELLAKNGYEVYCRDSKVRAFQLLTIYQIDLVIVDLTLLDATGLEFCQEYREESSFSGLPIIMIGEDDEEGRACVAALEAGAEDFIEVPFIPKVCLSRIARHVKKRAGASASVKTSLSVNVTADELPGILQFLEAELKTGRLEVKSGSNAGSICLREGRMTNAAAPFCEGVDAVTEILSWESVKIVFNESELEEDDLQLDEQITGIVMNSLVDVDEFHEVQKCLPSEDETFLPGGKKLPEEMAPGQVNTYEWAINGHSIEDLLRGQQASERKTTMWLHELIENGYLKVSDPPFHNYVERCHEQYQSTFFENRLLGLRKVLAEMDFAVSSPVGYIPIGGTDWLSPAPRLIVTGDSVDHVALFVQTMCRLYLDRKKARPPTQKHIRGADTTRLDFDDNNMIDIQQLPPILDKVVLRSVDDYLTDACAVIMIASAQDQKTTRANMRLLRQLRQRFGGVYFLIVPRVPSDAEKKNMFKINCEHCGYKLAVNMDDAGLVGECPICNKDIKIPDCIEHLGDSLNIPSEVPIMQFDVEEPPLCRDLLLRITDTVLTASRSAEDLRSASPKRKTKKPPESRPAIAEEEAEKTPEQEEASERAKALTLHSTPRGRPGADGEAPPPLPPDQMDTQKLRVPTKQDLLDQANETDAIPAHFDVEEILSTGDDDFDIDDFINKVRN